MSTYQKVLTRMVFAVARVGAGGGAALMKHEANQ